MPKSLPSITLSLLLAATPLYAAPADNQTAGEVKALIPAASRNAQPVKAKDRLEWNDLLKTDAQGRLRAGLTAGSILSLGSNSELQVVQHDAVSQQTLIVVNYGKLRSQVVKITKPDGKYEVRTPNAVIGVTGTDFYVGYANNLTTAICYVGKVAVTPASGTKVILTAGQMVVIGLNNPAGGYQASSTPALVAEASIQDTNVPDELATAGKTHIHTLRNVLIGLGAAAGLGLGLGIAERGRSSGSSSSASPKGIDLTNKFGTINVTNAGVVSKGSHLHSFNGIVAPPGRALGSVSFSTGAFTGASIWTGGTFSSVGSTFDVIGVGLWAKQLTGQSKNPITLYSGSFVGPIDWTVVSHTGKFTYNFTLSGAISGMLYTGRNVIGTTTQNITVYKNQWNQDHTGMIHLGNSHLNVPEPHAMGVPGKGLRAGAGSTRRKLFGWQFVW